MKRQSAANTDPRPVRGFEYRYTISKDRVVWDNVKNIQINKNNNPSATLIGANGKSYTIPIGKLIDSTFSQALGVGVDADFTGYIPVNGYPNYLTNRFGALYSTKRKKFISISIKNGYPRYNANLPERLRRVHRMIAEHFVPNPLDLPEVNHIDGNKNNYSLNNLEWVTSSENIRHAYKSGLFPKSTTSIKFTDKDGNSFYLYGLEEAKKVFNIDRSTVGQATKKYAGTGKYIPRGSMAGYRVDIFKCKVHRLSERSTAELREMVDSCVKQDEDIVKSGS